MALTLVDLRDQTARVLRSGDIARLDAGGRWVAHGDADAVDALCRALPDWTVERWGAHARLRFGNLVGCFDLRGLGRLEIVNGKWSQASFDAMLADLTARAAALPFRGGAGSSLPYERTVLDEPDLLWHAFVYLRYALSDAAPPPEHLASALALVVAEPHRRWRTVEEVVPVAAATDVDPGLLFDLATGRWPTTTVPRGRFVLGDRLRGRMPTEVSARRSADTLDTPENRFVLDVLRRCERLLDRVEVLARTGSVRADVADLRARLAPALSADLWHDVGRMTHVPAASTVLHGRRGYREVFRVAERMRLASRVPLDPSSLHDLLENRDVATLYELWVYFAVVQAVEHRLGPAGDAEALVRAPTQVDVPWRYRVSWRDGVSVTYNPTFSPGQGPGASWSVRLRPDVVLSVGPVRHVLDAKFKVDWFEELGDATDPDERVGAFRSRDVYKMHAYRDAIPDVATAWVVYPGTITRAWASPAQDGGVGALPASPGAEGELRALVDDLLEG